MNSPPPDLLLAAARLRLHLLSSEQLPPLADALLTRGIHAPALAQLASLKNPIMSDAAPLFLQALHELDIEFFSPLQSACLIIRTSLSEMTTAGDPLPFLDDIARIHDTIRHRDHTLLPALDLSDLMSDYLEYDILSVSKEFDTPPPSNLARQFESLRRNTLTHARNWLAAHS